MLHRNRLHMHINAPLSNILHPKWAPKTSSVCPCLFSRFSIFVGSLSTSHKNKIIDDLVVVFTKYSLAHLFAAGCCISTASSLLHSFWLFFFARSMQNSPLHLPLRFVSELSSRR
jgi:hypothetical protein